MSGDISESYFVISILYCVRCWPIASVYNHTTMSPFMEQRDVICVLVKVEKQVFMDGNKGRNGMAINPLLTIYSCQWRSKWRVPPTPTVITFYTYEEIKGFSISVNHWRYQYSVPVPPSRFLCTCNSRGNILSHIRSKPMETIDHLLLLGFYTERGAAPENLKTSIVKVVHDVLAVPHKLLPPPLQNPVWNPSWLSNKLLDIAYSHNRYDSEGS